MAPRKKSLGQKSEPKLFRCTGFGDCDMVFTRSEHLARHARKHTGEKPYKCVVPECGRMFSRFDNMMQHTQTHNKANNKKDRRKSSITHSSNKDKDSALFKYEAATEKEPSSMHPLHEQWSSPPPMSMISSRTLPLPRRMSYSASYYPTPSSPSFDSMPPPLSYRRGSLQSTSSTSSSISTDGGGRRRLSAADLQVPIHNFQESIGGEEEIHPLATSTMVDISSDEYEALQGFGKFSSRAQRNDSEEAEVLSPIHSNNNNNASSPMLSAQVAAFRQKLMPIQESFQRPIRNNAT